MAGVLLLWLLLTPPAEDPAASVPGNAGTTYKTAKTLQAVEKCLYEELSDLGDATFMRSPGETILMIRNGQGPATIIDVTPPTLAITTKASPEIRARVTRCL